MNMEMITARTIVSATSFKESRIVSDVSFATVIVRSESSAINSSTFSLTAEDTSISVLSCCF